jgi:hypothetical protein
MAKQKLWAIKVIYDTKDRGYLVEQSMKVAVYETEENANKETKWLNEFHKKMGARTSYQSVRFKEEAGMETEIQHPPFNIEQISYSKTSSLPKKETEKKLKPVIRESSEEAPRPMLQTNLSELFVGNLDTDGTL